MDVTNAILSRRSIRKFVPGSKITDEQIKTMLCAAMHAPSACNTRPWSFIAVTDRAQIDKMYAMMGQKQFKDAAAIVIVVALPERQQGICEGNHLNDCGAAAENLILQAWELGIGSVWCGLYPVKERMEGAYEIFGIPKSAIPFCAIPMGVPDESPDAKGKYEDSLVHWNKW